VTAAAGGSVLSAAPTGYPAASAWTQGDGVAGLAGVRDRRAEREAVGEDRHTSTSVSVNAPAT